MSTRKFTKYAVQRHYLRDDGVFPNNADLPVLVYRSVLELPVLFPSKHIVKLFKNNGWENAWKDGVYDFHHYHSKTHEVLGVYKGYTTLLIGGKNGIRIRLQKGDVIIIPAGVAHKNIEPEAPFKCVGAYPKGFFFDMKTGEPSERPKADQNIAAVPIPPSDPVFGINGELKKYWTEKKL